MSVCALRGAVRGKMAWRSCREMGSGSVLEAAAHPCPPRGYARRPAGGVVASAAYGSTAADAPPPSGGKLAEAIFPSACAFGFGGSEPRLAGPPVSPPAALRQAQGRADATEELPKGFERIVTRWVGAAVQAIDTTGLIGARFAMWPSVLTLPEPTGVGCQVSGVSGDAGASAGWNGA